MPLTYNTESPDTIETLIKKVIAIIDVNKESLQLIESRKGQQVILKYKTILSAKQSSFKKRKLNDENESDVKAKNNEDFFGFVNKKITRKVDDVLQHWRYQGPPLMKETIPFKFFLDLQLETYEDLARLNDEFLQLSGKYARVFRDEPESQEAVRVLLSNVEKLQIAIGKIHEKVLDVKDPLEKNEVVSQRIKIMSRELKLLKQEIPELEFKYDLPQSEESDDERKENIVSFNDLKKIVCKLAFSTLDSRGISALQNYVVDGKQYLASADNNGNINILDFQSQTTIDTLTRQSNRVQAFATYTINGSQMVATGCTNSEINLWNLKNRSLIKVNNDHGADVFALTIIKTGSKTTLISGDGNGKINLHNLEDYSLIAELTEHTGCIRSLVAYKLNGEYYFASGSADSTIKIWRLNDHRLVETVNCNVGIKKLVFAKYDDSSILVSLEDDGHIRVCNLEDNVVIHEFRGKKCWDMELVYCKGEPHLVCGSNKVAFLSLSGNMIITVAGYNSSCFKVFMNGQKPCIAIGDKNGVVRLWME